MGKMEFVLTHVVKNVLKRLENGSYHVSAIKEHFQVPWVLLLRREGDNIGFHLHCELVTKSEWSIETEHVLKVVSVTGKRFSKNSRKIFHKKSGGWGWRKFIKWEEMKKDFMIDGTLSIEAHVKILKMTGIKMRKFDVTTKHFSDIVLIAEGQRFYVSKLFLASQSPYFEALFLKSSEESEKSEVTLKEATANDLQKFLELLYGEPSIDEDTVEGIMKLADMYDAKLAVQKCEQFLIKESEMSLKDKLRMVKLFRLANLKHSCLSKINTVEEIRSVLAYDTNEMDPSVVGALLQKLLSLHL